MFGIFNKLGGEQATLDVLHRRRGCEKRLTHRAVSEWIWNREIPALNRAYLIEECRERGIAVEFDDFRLPEKLPARSERGVPVKPMGRPRKAVSPAPEAKRRAP